MKENMIFKIVMLFSITILLAFFVPKLVQTEKVKIDHQKEWGHSVVVTLENGWDVRLTPNERTGAWLKANVYENTHYYLPSYKNYLNGRLKAGDSYDMINDLTGPFIVIQIIKPET